MVKLSSYTFRFFFHTICDLRGILFHLLILFFLTFFFWQELFDHFFILPWFDCFSYWNWSPTRNVLYTTPERKKEKTWNLIKRWLKIPIPGFCPNNIFPTFRLLLKASLDLLKTSLAAITLLFFRSNQRWLLKPILYNTLSQNLVKKVCWCVRWKSIKLSSC